MKKCVYEVWTVDDQGQMSTWLFTGTLSRCRAYERQAILKGANPDYIRIFNQEGVRE